MEEPYYKKITTHQELLKRYFEHIDEYSKQRAQKIIQLFPSLAGKSVLDLGCGGGFYSLAAVKKGAGDITLLDILPQCVKAAKINLNSGSNLEPNGVVADATALPFKGESFDFVICVDVIEHILEDQKLLQEIERVLKTNGLLVLSTQNQNSLNYILEAPLQRYVLKNRKWMGWDPTHVRFYTPHVLFRLVRNSGFSIVKVSGTYFIPYKLALWFRRINRKLSQLLFLFLYNLNQKLERSNKVILKLFGWGVLCLCQKRRTC